jgi:hypothetical protein
MRRTPRPSLVVASVWAACALLSAPALAGDTPSPPGAEAHFANLTDGEKVHSPFVAKFAVTGLTVAPAGTAEPNTGHFHVLVDTTLTPEQMKYAIPADEQHIHYGKAQTEATLSLPPGPHTLQLVMGDGKHELHNPPVMSKVVKIEVE